MRVVDIEVDVIKMKTSGCSSCFEAVMKYFMGEVIEGREGLERRDIFAIAPDLLFVSSRGFTYLERLMYSGAAYGIETYIQGPTVEKGGRIDLWKPKKAYQTDVLL